MNDFWGIIGLMLLTWFLTFVFTEPPIRPKTVQFAEHKCQNNGGWKYIKEGYNRYATIYCNDGAEFNYNPSKLYETD